MRATVSLLSAAKTAVRKVVPLADRILVRRIEQQAKVSFFFCKSIAHFEFVIWCNY
jgi:hypothetical protein